MYLALYFIIIPALSVKMFVQRFLSRGVDVIRFYLLFHSISLRSGLHSPFYFYMFTTQYYRTTCQHVANHYRQILN